MNFERSGLLMKRDEKRCESNLKEEEGLKWSEPIDSCLPPSHPQYRLFVFKGEEEIDSVTLSGKSFFSIGRNERIVDIPAIHPSISNQHAILQFRRNISPVRLYLIDLGSTNGTLLNGSRIDSNRYYELLPNDILKFGSSSRDYVLIQDSEK